MARSKTDPPFFADSLEGVDTAERLPALSPEVRAAREVRDELVNLAVIAAHQLKSPLNSITTTLSLLIGGYAGPLEESQRELLRNATRSASRGTDLVSDLLRLRGLDVLTVENMVPVNAIDCLRIAVDRVRDAAQAGRVELVDTLRIENPAQAWLRAEPGVVQEVLYVLLDNAVKYTPEGGTVEVRLFVPKEPLELPPRPGELAGGPTAQIACEVIDSGIGIPPDSWADLFTEFYRAPNAKGLSREGTGLGLAFAERALRLLGGRLRLEPAASGGVRALSVFPGSGPLDAEATVEEAVRRISQRVVVVGGVTAGSKAAARIARLDPDAEVTVVERGQVLTYAGCRLAYYISGAVKERRALLSSPLGEVRDSSFFHALKNVRTLDFTEAVAVEPARQVVRIRRLTDGRTSELPYDHLVLATGARASVPTLPGLHLDGVYTLHRATDAEAIRRELKDPRTKEVVIIGAGPIGVQTAEAISHRGSRTSLIEVRDSILGIVDPQLGQLVAQHLQRNGVRIHTGCPVKSLKGDGRVRSVRLADGRKLPCDFVVLATGVEPDVTLAREAGLVIGSTGAVRVDRQQRTSAPRIFAVGDCCEDHHLLTGEAIWTPQGSTSSKQGRVAASTICGQDDALFPGVVGSVVMSAFGWAVGKTGLSTEEATAAGFDPVSSLIPAPDRAHYLPTSNPLLLKLVADRTTRRVLGLQVIGPGEAAKRLDVAATAITAGLDLSTLSQLDLSYSPEYSLALDSILIAANVILNKLAGLFEGIDADELQERSRSPHPPLLLDVRLPAEHGPVRMAGSLNLPLGALRGRLHEVPKDREIVTIGKTGLRAYEAALILRHDGYEQVRVLEGGLDAWPYALERP
jgi:NADPH-dependent 2,4-dienoyl-CoA reductase/sulfur reductase-like enzyme/signal transduction histidine kinase/rhodanese-related sulfurtransferase